MDKHNHKNCRHMLDSLSEFVDGTLADELCSEIQRHLDDCPDCHLVVDTLRKTIYLYRETAEPPDVPADVRQRLYQCLDLDEYLDK
jgi:anti-sigma factor (TIGR02949 family)